MAIYSTNSGVMLSKSLKEIKIKMLNQELSSRPSAKELKGIVINLLDVSNN